MFYISAVEANDMVAVTDTSDNTTEVISVSKCCKVLKMGISIEGFKVLGLNNYDIRVISPNEAILCSLSEKHPVKLKLDNKNGYKQFIYLGKESEGVYRFIGEKHESILLTSACLRDNKDIDVDVEHNDKAISAKLLLSCYD